MEIRFARRPRRSAGDRLLAERKPCCYTSHQGVDAACRRIKISGNRLAVAPGVECAGLRLTAVECAASA